MPLLLTSSVQATFLGKSYNQPQNTNADAAIPLAPDVTPAGTSGARAGTLTARTDNDTGSATLLTGHGITTGALVDVYWDGGARHNMTVGTVATNVVPLDGGVGDNFPVLTTPLVVALQHLENATFDGDDAVLIVVNSGSYRTTVIFKESDHSIVLAVVLDVNESYIWSDSSGITNPVSGGAVTEVSFTHESATATVTMDAAVGYN